VTRQKKGKKNNRRGQGGLWIWLVLFGFAYWALPAYRLWLVFGGALVLFLWLWAVAKRHRIVRDLSEIDRMDGHEFERFLVTLFKRLGYKASHIGASGGDFGADLIIEKEGAKICVQAKNYDNSVGNDAVQQAIAGAAYYDCQAALVVTNSTFTKAAVEQAAGSNLPVTLWDRNLLAEKLKKVS
jgi:restriction system protein